MDNGYRVAGISTGAKMKNLLLVFALLLSFSAVAEPLVEARSGTTHVMLYTDPCKLVEVVNLPNRAEWVDGDKKFEGCWTTEPVFGVVVMYFSDKTVILIPAQVFKKATMI